MDSIQELKERVRLSFTLGAKRPVLSSGFCCIRFESQGCTLVYVHHQADVKQLRWCQFVPWGKRDPLAVLSEIVKENDLEGVSCSLMLQSDTYYLLPLDALPVSAAEFQSAIRWKVKGLLPFPITDAVIDSFDIPSTATQQLKKTIMVVAAQLSVLQPLAERINASGLRLTTIDIPELALSNITSYYENDEMSTALIYVQEQSSDLIVTRLKEYYLSRRIDWGLQALTDMASDADKTQAYLDSLALEIQRSFDYFQGQWRLQAPARVLLAFSTPTAIDIVSALSQRLSIPMQRLDINMGFTAKQKLTVEQQGQYLPVIGGALRDEMTIDATN